MRQKQVMPVKIARVIHSEILQILTVVLLFVLFCSINIKKTGFDSDEASPAMLALGIMQPIDTEVYTAFPVNIANRALPTDMHMPYMFSLLSYILLPFLKIFGVNYYIIKMVPVFLIGLSLLALYFLIKELFGRLPALLTILLLASSSVFVNSVRMAYSTTEPFLNMFFWFGSLMLLFHLKGCGKKYLYFAAFLFGCGLSIKLSMLARLLSLAIALFVFYKAKVSDKVKSMRLKTLMLAFLLFFAGSVLFWLYNIMSGGNTFRLAGQVVGAKANYAGVVNSDIKSNLKLRIKQLKNILAEKVQYKYTPAEFLHYIDSEGNIFPLLYLFSVLVLSLRILFMSAENRRKLLFIGFLFIAMFFFSLFSPGSMSMSHLTIIYPFPQLLFALSVNELLLLTKAMTSRKLSAVLVSAVIILILLPVAVNLSLMKKYHMSYKIRGGKGVFSDYIFEVLKFLQDNNIKKVYVSHTEIRYSGIIASGNSIEFLRIYKSGNDLDDAAALLDDILNIDEDRFYYIEEHVNMEESKWVNSLMRQLVSEGDIRQELLKTIRNRKHEEVFSIYKLYKNGDSG